MFSIIVTAGKERVERGEGMIYEGDQSSFSAFDLYREKQQDYISNQRDQVSLCYP